MLRTKTGWVAQRKEGEPFTVGEIEATGIFLNYTPSQIHIYYAGVDGLENRAGKLPADAHLLRELAKALNEAANEYEDRSYRPRLHMLAEKEV